MPLQVESWELGTLRSLVDGLPSEVRSAVVVVNDNTFSVRWDDSAGEHTITWKEPRK